MSKNSGGYRFVTLEGEMINAGGAITGGRYMNKTANIPDRKAESPLWPDSSGHTPRRRDKCAAELKLQAGKRQNSLVSWKHCGCICQRRRESCTTLKAKASWKRKR
ncbi:MAG: hypothetical protein V8Q42_05760 [Anaerovoracaceae bacterium]